MNTSIYAGFWKRAIAFIIDTFLAALPPIIICLPLMIWQVYSMANAPEAEYASRMMVIFILMFALQILSLVSFWLYFALQESGKHQATWGKRLLKIKVVGKDGGRITFARATGRTFAKFLSSMILYIGFIMAGLTNRKRALHDYIAETYVVADTVQPADELPDTPSHPWWIAIASVGMVLLFAAMAFLNVMLTQLPLLHSFAAASTLQNMAMQDMPYGSQTVNGVTYSVDPDGYRATFSLNGDTYTLYLEDEDSDVCCAVFPGEDCAAIGMDVCR